MSNAFDLELIASIGQVYVGHSTDGAISRQLIEPVDRKYDVVVNAKTDLVNILAPVAEPVIGSLRVELTEAGVAWRKPWLLRMMQRC